MKKLIRSLQALDYVVGAAVVGYGIYSHSWLTAALGVGGLGLARLNLAERVSSKLRTYLRRKQELRTHAVDPDFEAPLATPMTEPSMTPSYDSQRFLLGTITVGSSRHSVLKTADSLNHASDKRA
jgi:hypothetical protein